MANRYNAELKDVLYKVIQEICIIEIDGKVEKMGKKKKICLIANGGGHYEQIRQLKEVYDKYDCFYVVMKTDATKNAKEKTHFIIENTHSNEFIFLLRSIIILFQSLYIILKEKPDVIISTGAGATVPLCVLAKKVFKKKLIFIESFAKRESPTKTGLKMYEMADLFIVQWDSMLKFYPDAVVGGWIY